MISVIIPARNEAETLRRTLGRLAGCALGAPPGRAEYLVIVGESDDGTEAAAAGLARVVQRRECSRAALLNAGAAVAKGEVLFFLHADSLPPPDYVAAIEAALSDPTVVGGAFDHRFAEDVLGLRLVSWMNRLRYRLTRNYYGDQGIFVRRRLFRALGGFPDRGVLEDLAFSRLLKRSGRTVVIPSPIRTSGRRFLEGGIARTFLFIVWLLFLETCRLDTERYAHTYRRWAGQQPF